MKQITFYKVNEPLGFFSNFALYPIFIRGEIWKTIEHFFQASKFESDEIKMKIKMLNSPLEAANEGRSRRNELKQDWEDIKENVMKEGLWAKFTQHPELKTQLLNTEDAHIVERSEGDEYWGSGRFNAGKNRLGVLLMIVRADIRAISKDTNVVFPPWIAFPDNDQFNQFWRMGLGEDYLAKWSQYYLACMDKKQYIDNFPPPQGWEDIYE